MTIERAKSELMQIYGALSPDKQRAIDTLVKIELCDDVISRQATLEPYKILKDTDTLCVALIRANIMQQPSVKQEPKTGHWIEDDMTYCGVDLTNYKCDKCGEIGGSWRKGLKPDKLPKYCMNCGAKMVEPQESEATK